MMPSDIRAPLEPSEAARPPMIELRGIRKVYPMAGGEVVALDHVDLTVRQGDIYGIVGLSGAGKSTLIRCVNRLEEPTEGSILLEGRNILAMEKKELLAVRRSISMIFQHFNLLMQKTVGKNVRYPLEIAGVPKREANQRVKELLKIVGLEEKEHAYPSQLSGGQKQRVAIARALATNPRVLLCDEATSALDPMTTQAILRLLQEINRNLGITIVIITHEMAVIRQICTHVAIMDGGAIAEEGSVEEVFTHTRSDAGRRLFGILPAKEEAELPALAEPALRVVFHGQVEEPIIANLILHLGISLSILSADVRNLRGVQYGQMLIKKPQDPEECRKAVAYLRDKGLSVEEVGRS